MKILLLLWCVASIVLGFWLYFEFGLSWYWAAFDAFAVCVMMLILADVTLDRINFFIPLRDRLVEGWRQAHRWWSVRLMAAAGFIEVLDLAIRSAWLELPPAILSVVPPELLSQVSVGLLVLGILARLVKQKNATASP